MKTYGKITITYLLGLVLMAFLAGPLQGQDKKTDKLAGLLIGSWQLDFEKSIEHSQLNPQVVFGRLPADRQGLIRKTFNQRKLIFLDKGICRMGISPGRQVSGSWELLNDRQTIAIKFEGGKRSKHKIEQISTTGMVLQLEKEKADKQLFEKWYLVKTNN